MTLYKFGVVRIGEGTAELEGSSVARLADGSWVVVWSGFDTNTQREAVFQQHYAPDGKALIAETSADYVISATGSDQPLKPIVTALADGGWVVDWTAHILEPSTYELFQQRFLPNQAPSGATLAGNPVAEATANGTVVGVISGTDLNLSGGDTLRYELVDNAGGRFALQGNKIVVANGLKLDYEQAASHVVAVKVIDKDGLSTIQNLTVNVGDVARENVTGSAGADHFVGGADVDLFSGLAGNDTLAGGSGNDILTGGLGQDVFVFTASPNKRTNYDKVTDYNVRDDTIWLDNAVFTKLGKNGSEFAPAKINKAFFTVATKAKDSNDYIVFNKAKGVLYYDSDGSGAKAAVEIATLKKNLKITASDFFVI